MFYVTDLTGGKLVQPQRQAALRQNLLAVFERVRPPERPAAEP